MRLFKYILILIIITLTSCKDDEALPKPNGYLRLDYPKARYQKSVTAPYEFETNKNTIILVNEKHWMRIKYPNLHATLDVTYRTIDNNVEELLKETEKLTLKHAAKADAIYYDSFDNIDENVYGKLNSVTGNAASPIQFHITDSTKNFLVGAVYFNTQPNYDSIYPAIKYIEKDIKRLISTTKWRN